MKAIRTTAILFSFVLLISATEKNNLPHYKSPIKPTATFKKQTVDFDVYENGQKGMRIHLDFNVTELRGIDCYLLITFEKKDGDKYYYMTAKDEFGDYANLYGDLIHSKKLTPCCDNTDYNDLQLFMPYDELNLSSGRFDLRMDVDVTKDIDDTDDQSADFIGHLNYYTFWFSK